MGLVRQNQFRELLGLFIYVCIALYTIVAHNIAQNRPDNFPPYPSDNHHISDDVYLREGGHICPSVLFSSVQLYRLLGFMACYDVLAGDDKIRQLVTVKVEIRSL